MAERIRILIVDDEVRFLQTLSQRLSLRDFDVTPFSNGRDAVEAARQQPFDIALLDLKMPGMPGEQVLAALKAEHPDLEVVILTGHGSIDSAVDCTRSGSYRYLQKPCETETLMNVLLDAYQHRVQRKLEVSEERMSSLLGAAVGESPLAILRRLKEIAGGK